MSQSERRSRNQKKLHMEFKAKIKKLNSRDEYVTMKLHFQRFGFTDFIIDVATNNTDRVEEILRSGFSPNIADINGRSALHIAASKGYTEMVRILLENGANPNICDKWSNTPLHLAACSHNLPIINLLLKFGADVKRLDAYGRNPLQLAESKLQLLQRSWREGAIEMTQIRSDLKLIVEIMISMFSQKSDSSSTNVDELEFMKLSLNDEPPQEVGEQMSKLLTSLQTFKIT